MFSNLFHFVLDNCSKLCFICELTVYFGCKQYYSCAIKDMQMEIGGCILVPRNVSRGSSSHP